MEVEIPARDLLTTCPLNNWKKNPQCLFLYQVIRPANVQCKIRVLKQKMLLKVAKKHIWEHTVNTMQAKTGILGSVDNNA